MKKKKKISIVTWGDGFDMVMSATSKTREFNNLVKELISINPSVLDNGIRNQTYEKKIAYYNNLLKKGIFSTEKSSEFLKIKTLSDMMTLKPQDPSPFSKTLGYEKLTNRETLRKYMKEKDHPLLSLNYNSNEYSIRDLSDIYMQPVPLFNMAVPVTLIRDINKYWAEALKKSKKEKIKTTGNYPITFLYSESFDKNVETITSVLNPESDIEKIKIDNLSTIEIIMSQSAKKLIFHKATKN